MAHLTPKQKGAIGKLPKWDEFLQALEAGIYWYNHEHQHREIGGKTPYAKRKEMMAQMNEQELCYITEVEARDLFRPEVVRTPERGWVRLFNGFYFHQKLLDVDGQKVRVAFDIHDPSKVIIRTLDGVFVCYAELDGNKREAFPLSFVEKVRKERYQRRVKLKQEQLKEIEQELNPVLSIEKSEGAQILHTLRVRDGVDVAQDSLEEIAVFPSELKRKQKKGM